MEDLDPKLIVVIVVHEFDTEASGAQRYRSMKAIIPLDSLERVAREIPCRRPPEIVRLSRIKQRGFVFDLGATRVDNEEYTRGAKRNVPVSSATSNSCDAGLLIRIRAFFGSLRN